MVSARLLALVRCPECLVSLDARVTPPRCPRCGRAADLDRGYVDLRPRTAFGDTTKYVDEALHADARHESVSPPLLGAGVRNHMLRRFLAIGPTDRVVDLGCGSGRMILWNADAGAWHVGVDVSPFFAREALGNVDLVLADLRRLPFPDGAFTKAWSLDVAEHLSLDALAAVLGEAARVLEPGGSLFLYSHVRKNAPIAAGLRWINRFGRALDRAGIIDTSQERLRKSDHVNPLRDVPHLEDVVRQAGFRIQRIRYYTPLLGGLVENILMRIAERALARRAVRTAAASRDEPPDPTAGVRAARTTAKARLARRGALYHGLRLLTWVMMLDVIVFGHIRSGPFFALLVKEPPVDGTPGAQHR